MTRKDFEARAPMPDRARDRIIDWLGAQGASLLSIYMCGAVAFIAFLVDAVG